MSLIPRFYDPTGGRVLIDGVDMRDYKLAALRAQIGFVLQETVLFRGTIRDNIAYGRPDATRRGDRRGGEARQRRRIHRQDAARLRLGRRRARRHAVGRPAPARSASRARDPQQSPILILDEPTAALDTESERLVIEGLERLMKGRTVITIAHRLSTIRDADKIIVLKDGVVAEEGTHDELVASRRRLRRALPHPVRRAVRLAAACRRLAY